MNYYKLLGLSRSASDDEIKVAYLNMRVKYNSDEEKLNILNIAHETLLNKTAREEYDSILPLIEQQEEKQRMKERRERERRERQDRSTEIRLKNERTAQELQKYRENQALQDQVSKELKHEKESAEEVEKRRIARAKRWREQGLCIHCGGRLAGILLKKCRSCKRKKQEL